MKHLPLAVVAVIWIVATAGQVHLWRGPEIGIWLHAVQIAPEKPRPWVNLGRQHALAGDVALAESDFVTALGLAAARPTVEHGVARDAALANRERLHFDLLAWISRTD